MPLTDSYGQNVQYPTLTDKPNAQSLSEGLVTGIVPKVVMQFASATVRGATITKPVAGMVTWLKDVKRLEVYDGSGWSTITAGTSAWKTISPSPPSYTHNGNSQGNFAYRVVNLFGEIGLMFRGGLNISYVNKQVATNVLNFNQLPVEARPSSLRTLVVPCSDVNSARITLKMDVTTDGWLKLVGIQSDTNPPWVGFNGVFCSL